MGRPTTEAAKKIRADIKTSAAAKELGEYPASVTFSVRTEYASLMSAIDVTIKGAPDEWVFIESDPTRRIGGRRDLTPSIRALADLLYAIVTRYYEPNQRSRFVSINVQQDESRRDVL
jgi:hypothetical protein